MNTKLITDIRDLLIKMKLEAVVIYSGSSDDRFMKAIAGTPSLLEDYVLITPKNAFISEPRYITAYTRRKTTIPILDAPSERQLIEPLIAVIGGHKNIGIAGSCRYQDIVSLKPNQVTDITSQINKLLRHKSDSYIKKLKKLAKSTSRIMESLAIKTGDQQSKIAQKLHTAAIELNGDLAFPICITSGRDLETSTSTPASAKVIRKNDAVCIDMGIKSDIYATDCTRMYFINHPNKKALYLGIVKAHNEIIDNFIRPERTFREIIDEYHRKFKNHRHIKEIRELGIGHGIGYGLHEYPEIAEVDKEPVGTNIVFTLEPTFITTMGRFRVEDMISVDSQGVVSKLT